MKQLIILVASVLCWNITVAQTQWGVKAGINYNEVRLENVPFLPISGLRSNIGFHIGGFGELGLSKKWFLHMGLQFIQMGANSTNYTTNPSTKTRINLNYLEMPILISHKLVKTLRLEFGPSISYTLSAKETPADTSKNLDQIFVNDFDFGINGGLRIAVYENISVWGRYYHGFRQPSNFPNMLIDTKPESTKKNFQLGIGYSF